MIAVKVGEIAVTSCNPRLDISFVVSASGKETEKRSRRTKIDRKKSGQMFRPRKKMSHLSSSREQFGYLRTTQSMLFLDRWENNRDARMQMMKDER